jgi:hypothetical protein
MTPSHASAARRREQMTHVYRRLATAFLLERRPDDSDLILLNLTLVEAALSGDRAQLSVVLRVLRRLARYLPEDSDFREEMGTCLWTLGATCVSAMLLLEIEFDTSL